ncbi:MAG: amidohydrolase family protein [Bryobacterales bacterium]|nr:amidohydrolase family protein [Bryobacterales bacterium]
MLRQTGIVLFLFAPLCLPAPKALLFGKLWDGSGKVTNNAIVVVDGSRIVQVSTSKSGIPRNAEWIDLRRFSGLPGLIDAHTHITYYWEPKLGKDPLQRSMHPLAQVHLARENARLTLATGVTTIRNLNAFADSDIAVRDLIDKGFYPGPRIFTAGQGVAARTPSEMESIVKARIKAGHPWIKVFASRGGFDDVSTTQTVPFDAMRAAVDTAHAVGHKVAIHSYGPEGVRDAARAGADSIEHGIGIDDETLRLMAQRNIYWVPTIDHNRYYMDARHEYGFSGEAMSNLRQYVEKNLETARRAVKAGVKLVMGSDAVYTMFGQNTRELEWFVKAGLTPEQALHTATANAAAMLGLETQLGRIAPGAFADIIAVEGEPWKDIQAVTERVRWVMKDGEVVHRR